MDKPILIKDLGMIFATQVSKNKQRYGIYQCPFCKNEFRARVSHIQGNKILSCGCKAGVKHGQSKHRLYITWQNMIRRCYDNKSTKYHLYGGKGITVCDKWHNVSSFINDMFPSFEEGLTLDRINPKGNYEPSNCRWANQTVQTRNTINIPSHNTSGVVGVYFNKTNNKWIANICINNKTKYIGSFINKKDALDARNLFIKNNNLEHTIRSY